jgi:hypothetical protein
MEYEGSIGLVTGKVLSIAKKHDLSDKKFFVCHAPLPPFAKICTTPTVSPLQARELKFGSRIILGQLDVPHTQNLEI